jgi:hypothetical protein
MEERNRKREVSQPKAAERRAQAVARSGGFSAPRAGAVTPGAQHPLANGRVVVAEHGAQESVGAGGAGGQEQALLSSLPAPHTCRHAGARRPPRSCCAVAPAQPAPCDLPAAGIGLDGIGLDDAPGILGGGDRLGGQQMQIPRLLTPAASRAAQPQRRCAQVVVATRNAARARQQWQE